MMDWNAKWDWENFALFGSKVTDIPKKLQFADFFIGDDGELEGGSFNQSIGGGNSGASGSDGWHESSIWASTESSTNDGMQTPPSFRLMTAEDAPKNISMVIDKAADIYATSPPPEAFVGSLEPLIGLKLGKRTYYENKSGHIMKTPLQQAMLRPHPQLPQTEVNTWAKFIQPHTVWLRAAILIFPLLKTIIESIESARAILNAPRWLLEGLNAGFANNVAGSILWQNLTIRSAVVEEDSLITMHAAGSHSQKFQLVSDHQSMEEGKRVSC